MRVFETPVVHVHSVGGEIEGENKMIDRIKKFFGKTSVKDGNKGISEHDIRIATCALFLEISQIDGEFSDLERGQIIETLKQDYGLSDDLALSLFEAAKEELNNSVDLWQFTNLINKNYTPEEKIQIIETVWRIAYTDDLLDKHEDYLARKLANLLRLTHKQLIDAKLKVKGEMQSVA